MDVVTVNAVKTKSILGCSKNKVEILETWSLQIQTHKRKWRPTHSSGCVLPVSSPRLQCTVVSTRWRQHLVFTLSPMASGGPCDPCFVLSRRVSEVSTEAHLIFGFLETVCDCRTDDCSPLVKPDRNENNLSVNRGTDTDMKLVFCLFGFKCSHEYGLCSVMIFKLVCQTDGDVHSHLQQFVDQRIKRNNIK